MSDLNFPISEMSEDTWVIPSFTEVDSLPLAMTDSQLQSMVLTIWKEFMLHDEVMSAISFLSNAPYRVRHTAATEKALAITKSTIEWMNNKIHADIVNTPADPNGSPLDREVSSPLPMPLSGQVAGRFEWISQRLPAGCSLVDFGCIDGTMTNRWGLAGFKATGVDMSQNSVALANAKALEFNTGARHISSFFKDAPEKLPNNAFDVFTCADTYEHIVDPVADLLVPARKLIRGDGKALLVTPHGAWFRGQYVPWAHPWIWYGEGQTWLARKPRGHIVAPTVWSVAADFRKAGFWVKECSVVVQHYQDVPGQGNICVEALASTPPIWPGFKFSFYDEYGDSKFEPLASTLAALGHTVEIFKPLRNSYEENAYGERISDFVSIFDVAKASEIQCDVLITTGSVPSGSRSRHAYPPVSHIDLIKLASR